MSINTNARHLVESYPPCGENYHKAIDALKSRFARDELLIECYVRGLQNLVLEQAKGQNLDIRTLYDQLQTHLQALETLGVTKDKYAAMLFPMVESALSEDLLRAWNRNRAEGDHNTDELGKLLTFLRKEVESEERIKIARDGGTSNSFSEARPATMAFVTTANSTPNAKVSSCKTEKAIINNCIWCDKTSHSSSECNHASKMSLDERIDFIKKKKGCLICLKIGHWSKKCRSFPRCLYCKRRHLTLMCSKLSNDADNNEPSTTSAKSDEVLICKKENTTLLQTILVELTGQKKVKVRALIDGGAQRSFIKSDVARKIGLQSIGKEEMCHGVFGGTKTETKEHLIYDVNISSVDKSFSSNIIVIEQNDICGYIPKVSECLIAGLKRRGIILTESTDSSLTEISLLIGADYCGSLMKGEIIQLGNNLTAIKTYLGWTVQGMTVGCRNSLNTLLCTSNIEVTDLWSLETLGIKDPVEQLANSEREQQVLESFNQGIKVNEEGRYEVRLPWKDVPRPDTNYDLARKRLESTTKRLLQLGKIDAYNNVFQEWLKLGIIELTPVQDITGHYLPHHPVIKDSSQTTKIRPVFDASARDKYGISLNGCLDKGVNIIECIPQLLIDFRKGAIGVTSDIAKAFLQISLAPDDREYLKFLWWLDSSENDEKVITYRHKRVVFGVTSSPFHLSATINYHLNNCPKYLRETALKLRRSFYVDNCVTSVDSVTSMHKFINESKKLMSNGMFDLRCWVTAPERIDETATTISVLGVLWDTLDDSLFCNINSIKVLEGKLTKRNILSAIQKIFDPIGICSATTIVPKILIQKAWMKKLSWDQELPTDIATEFKGWLNTSYYIKDIKIPRRLTFVNFVDCQNSIHVFCDASSTAYAACIFLRSQHGDRVDVRLVIAKSRVAPVKKATVPRLELIAALMGTRLYSGIITSLRLENMKTYFWTDSSVTLSWIKGDGNWSVFVSNRVREIKRYSHPEEWNHIPGYLNPADLPSRGVNPNALYESRWWEGPQWLKREPKTWPISDFTANANLVNLEFKEVVVNTVVASDDILDRLTYFSSYKKIVRTIAWMLRLRKGNSFQRSDLCYEEIEYAEHTLIKLIQRKHDYTLVKGSKLLTFKDKDGVLRLNTKLELGEEPFKYKFPVILPGNELVVQRLVEEKHRALLHAGVQCLMVNIREFVWIIGLRRLCKKVINKCIKCKRYSAKSCQTVPIGLPIDRMKAGKAFEVTGIDLAGPLLLRSGDKCWVVLYTCAIYRAVHLELVTSLSTDAFLMAFRRFIARRGRVKIVYTDNGTNFVGARNKLECVDYTKVFDQLSDEKIKWRLIPPGAPWWGGWWERLIGIIKDRLKRSLGRASLSYIELETVLCDVEAVVNQRPLTYVAGDEEQLKPLTPAMYIQPLPSSEVSDLDEIDSRGLNVRLNYLMKLKDDLRHRFRTEYLSTLVQVGKGVTKPLCVGDIVLVEDENKRNNWPLGLVLDLIPGNEKMRPVQKLYPLELSVQRVTDDNDPGLTPSVCDISDTTDCCSKPVTTRLGRAVKLPKRFW